MALSEKYTPAEIEDKWYQQWLDNKVFTSNVDTSKESFSVVIPPPNVTGVLHMGHMLNNTIQDVLVRKARMEGKEACWVPGTDHASIATESKVVKMLEEQGIKKSDISREEFLGHAMQWKDKYGGIILEQLKKIGASCDWDRTQFTMDPEYSKSVIEVFVDLYNKGLIYRGARMVNWDPLGQTALSDEEVIHKEVQSNLYYINYKVVGSDELITIATTRPETILGDTAICINPKDERYTHLQGKKAIVPLVGREIPIIFDEYVDLEFGTGCLKVTPAHDINDHELGMKHHLESIDILNDDGTLNENAGILIGEDRFAARKKVVILLKEQELFVKQEQINNSVGRSERTNAVIEPKISTQWFCKMKGMAEPALEKVLDDTIQIHPAKFKNMYRSWMEDVKDWCVSRQLWWGHRIPAYYLPSGQIVVASSDEEALLKAQAIDSSLSADDIKQDEDVLDTWFSSWIWPISVFKNITEQDNKEFDFYYPTDVLVTGFDIIFFWVARMIMAGYEFTGKLPFKHVYITGMVRDEKGRKMSKSLGNSPDPLDLIKEYGADGVRVGMLLTAPAGNDLLFDKKLCEQGRNFGNKIWNAYRLINSWEVEDVATPHGEAISWMQNRIEQATAELEDSYSKFRLSDALMTVYKLIWDDYCSWYLEMIKPAYGKPNSKETVTASEEILKSLLKLAHPFMPFLTEELWHQFEDSFVAQAAYPKASSFDEALLTDIDRVKQVVTAIRNVRKQKQLAQKDTIEVFVKTKDTQFYSKYDAIVCKLVNASSISFATEKQVNAAVVVVGEDELSIPLGEIDVEEELGLLKKELAYTQGFFKSVSKKLSNERFVQNAPEQVVAIEKQKMADAEARIKALEESITAMS